MHKLHRYFRTSGIGEIASIMIIFGVFTYVLISINKKIKATEKIDPETDKRPDSDGTSIDWMTNIGFFERLI